MSDTSETSRFPTLKDAEFILLTTYRRDGQGVPTTVLFAEAGDRLFVTTGAQASKAKRVRATGRVRLAPSTAQGQVLGPETGGQGRLLDPPEFAAAEAALRAKYPMFVQMLEGGDVDMRQFGGRIYLEIHPAAG